MEKITLYQFEECPYCAKVRAYMDKKGIEYEKVNVAHDREDSLRKELLEKSGVGSVPVMKYGDEYIGDSGAIIEFLNSKSQ